MRKKGSWLLVFGLLIGTGYGAYRIDQHKKEKESFVDLQEVFSRSSFRKISFPFMQMSRNTSIFRKASLFLRAEIMN